MSVSKKEQFVIALYIRKHENIKRCRKNPSVGPHAVRGLDMI